MTTPGKPVFGGGALRVPQIFSPNFNVANPAASPAMSWALFQSGIAYFFGLVLSGGTITGPDYIINSAGAFFYSGTPAGGNLAASIASTAGTDAFANAFKAGIAVYGAAATFVQMTAGTPARVNLGTGDAAEATPGGILTAIVGAGPTRALDAALAAPRVTGQAAGAFAQVLLESASPDLTIPPDVVITASDGVVSGTLAVTASAVSVQNAPLIATAGTAAKPTLISTDTWQTVTSFGAGFAAGGPTPQYALMPFGAGGAASVAIRGQVLATGATAVGAPMFTLPYTFARQHDYITPNNLAGAALGQRIVRVAASGAVQCQAVGANTNFVILDGIIANRG